MFIALIIEHELKSFVEVFDDLKWGFQKPGLTI